MRGAVVVSLLVSGCCFRGGPAVVDAGVVLAPLTARPLVELLPLVDKCAVLETDAGLPSLAPAPLSSEVRAWSCLDPVTLQLLEYADNAAAKKASLHLAAGLWRGSEPSANSPAELLVRLNVLAVVSGAAPSVLQVANRLVKDLGFTPAIDGRTQVDALSSGMGAALGGALNRHAPSSFSTASAVVTFGCPRPRGSPCEDLWGFDMLPASDPPKDVRVVRRGTCWQRKTETPCWLMWSALGIDLGSSPTDEKEILEIGPGFVPVYSALTHVARLGGKRGWLLVRGDDEKLVAVEMTENRDVKRVGVFPLSRD